MPGAQPRRSTLGRMSSSATRGVNVPAGAPGVYRVRQPRAAAGPSSDSGAAAKVAFDWVQSDNMVLSATPAYIDGAAHEAYFDDSDVLRTLNGSAFLAAPDNYPIGGKVAEVGFFQWFASASFFDIGAKAADALYVPPSLPPGATGYEYESPQGTLVSGSCHLVGTGRWSVTTTGQTWSVNVRRYPRAGYTLPAGVPTLPGDSNAHNPETNPDIAALYGGGAVLDTFLPQPTGTTVDFDFLTGDPDAEGWVGLLAILDADFATVLAALGAADTGSSHAFDLSNNAATTPELAATFTPPRYRFTA